MIKDNFYIARNTNGKFDGFYQLQEDHKPSFFEKIIIAFTLLFNKNKTITLLNELSKKEINDLKSQIEKELTFSEKENKSLVADEFRANNSFMREIKEKYNKAVSEKEENVKNFFNIYVKPRIIEEAEKGNSMFYFWMPLESKTLERETFKISIEKEEYSLKHQLPKFIEQIKNNGCKVWFVHGHSKRKDIAELTNSIQKSVHLNGFNMYVDFSDMLK